MWSLVAVQDPSHYYLAKNNDKITHSDGLNVKIVSRLRWKLFLFLLLFVPVHYYHPHTNMISQLQTNFGHNRLKATFFGKKHI